MDPGEILFVFIGSSCSSSTTAVGAFSLVLVDEISSRLCEDLIARHH